jgi:hypothetical protein
MPAYEFLGPKKREKVTKRVENSGFFYTHIGPFDKKKRI